MRTGLAQALWVTGTPLRRALIGLITAYQRFISPMTPPTCRFYPSCAAYGRQSLRVHGVVKGLTLTTWRVLRCHPWSKGGVDPVPGRGCWHPEHDDAPRLSAA